MKTFITAAGVLAAMAASAPAQAWEPAKPVEIVVAAGAGGASDQMARMMQAAIQKNNLMKQPIVVSLKGGASGAEARRCSHRYRPLAQSRQAPRPIARCRPRNRTTWAPRR